MTRLPTDLAMRLTRAIPLAAAILVAIATPAAAQQPLASAPPAVRSGDARARSASDPRPVASAAPRTADVAIDGRLDDAAWAAATPIGELVQQSPDEGAAPTEKTELRVLYDGNAVYVGARMYDSKPPQGILVRRDQLVNSNLSSDRISLVFDPFHDRNTRAWFELNPDGVKGDHMNGDTGWDPVWEGAAQVDSLGWTAEFRIPLSQLRFGRDSVQVWGFQVYRTIARRNEQDMWAFWKLNENGGAAYFGTIQGLRLPQQPRQMEFVPYVVSKSKFERAAANDPFNRTREQDFRTGADLKLNLTSALTLDATINPDFGQVEVDPAVVNLSAFETVFQEKRPFFISNSQNFGFGSFSCIFCSNVSNLGVFYSRRIGRSPQLAGVLRQRAEYADIAEASTILGAAKVTGRTRSGWTIGLLDALTDRVDARFIPEGGGPTRRMEIEPRTNYFYGRLRKDFNKGDTRVGVAATRTDRFMNDTAEVARLRRDATTLGADMQHFWGKRAYSVMAQLAVTDVRGDTAAIRRTQLTPAHYYQRPDRPVASDGFFRTRFDPNATSMGGYGLYARIAKDGGNWVWEHAQNWRSPGFEVNDISVVSRADYRWMNANVGRRFTKPTSWYRDVFTAAGGQLQWNYQGDMNDLQQQAYLGMTLLNYWSINGFVMHHPVTYDERLTRGGPTVKRTGYDYFNVDLGGDSRKSVVWGTGGNVSTAIGGPGGGWSSYLSLTLKPSSRVQLSFSPSYGVDRSGQQYVSAVSDPLLTAFGGHRYVFATIEQRTLEMSTRVSATFTPTLTLELFAQPFIASGRYYDYKQFAAPRTVQMQVYGRDVGTIAPVVGDDGLATDYDINPGDGSPSFRVGNPDFNFRSLRGTAVMRWEYRPGSTLFLVWTQERSGADAFGTFDFARERAALFGDRPTNVIQLKASYWIGR